MKKNYVKPYMENEMFVANEYVAACAVASFICNIPDSIVAYETNGVKGFQYWAYTDENGVEVAADNIIREDADGCGTTVNLIPAEYTSVAPGYVVERSKINYTTLAPLDEIGGNEYINSIATVVDIYSVDGDPNSPHVHVNGATGETRNVS